MRPHRHACRLFCVFALVTGAAHAEAPPIQPGLWEVISTRTMNGKPMPDPMAQFKKMPPAMQAQMKAQMAQRGVGAGQDGKTRICYTPEMLAQDRWRQPQGGTQCTTTPNQASATRWTWHTQCLNPPMEADGEAIFHSRTAYTVHLDMKRMGPKGADTMRMTMQSQWIKTDCGAVKPLPKRP